MGDHVFIDFQADVLPKGIVAIRRIRREGYVIGHYDLYGCCGAKLRSPQLTILQHDKEPFTLHRQPMGQRYSSAQRIQRGQIHITPPENIFLAQWLRAQTVFAVALSPEFIAKAISAPRLAAIHWPPRIGIDDENMASIFEFLKRQLVRSTYGTAISHACAMLAGIIYDTYLEQSKSTPIASGGLGPSRLRRVLDYIDANIHESMTLNELSSVARISQDYFGRSFKSSTGLSPLRYIAQSRLRKAKELLTSSNLTITEIALSLGYSTPSHFSDSFRKAMGTTPSRWRIDRQ